MNRGINRKDRHMLGRTSQIDMMRELLLKLAPTKPQQEVRDLPRERNKNRGKFGGGGGSRTCDAADMSRVL